MGTVSRHAGAPYADGETLAGADLETDIANIVSEINGNLDNSNIVAGADISGAKIADDSMDGSKLIDATVTKAKIATGGLTQCSVAIAAEATTAMTNATTLQDVPSVTAATMTPSAVGDMIELDFTTTVKAANTTRLGYYFTFSVDGTDQDDLIFCVARADADDNEIHVPIHLSWAGTATATTAMVFKPRYRFAGGAYATAAWSTSASSVFRARIIPQE